MWGPVVLQMAVIFAASSIPNLEELPGGAPDWFGHGAGYALLGALLLRALAGGRRAGVRGATAIAAVLCATLYGASDEWHQSFVSGRSPALNDLAADTLGAAVAAGLGWVWGVASVSRRRRRARPERAVSASRRV